MTTRQLSAQAAAPQGPSGRVRVNDNPGLIVHPEGGLLNLAVPRPRQSSDGRTGVCEGNAGPRAVAGTKTAPNEDMVVRAGLAVRRVTDPEMPYLTLEDLGVLRSVQVTQGPGKRDVVVVEIMPTYLGCPAMAEMKADIVAKLAADGFTEVDIRTVLDPPWSSDLITEAGRAKLAAEGIAPPSPANPVNGSVALGMPVRRPVAGRSGKVGDVFTSLNEAATCPRCGSEVTELLSTFSGTACKALHRCLTCREPFEQIKAV